MRPQQEDKALDTVAILISGGACSNIPDKSGITPLHVAAELGNTQICVYLTNDGRALVNAIDQHGATPLHYAVNKVTGMSQKFFFCLVLVALSRTMEASQQVAAHQHAGILQLLILKVYLQRTNFKSIQTAS